MSQEQYGINVGSHQIIQDSCPENQLLVDVLQTFGVERSVIDTIDNKAADGFDVRNMRAGHPYTILRSTESQDVEFFIYEETEENFVVIDLRDGVDISRGNQPVSTEQKSVYLPITTSLYEATRDKGVDVALVKSLEGIFGNRVDFRHLDAGDFCKVIFEERYVDGAFIGLGQVLAAEFHQGRNTYQAFSYPMNDSLNIYIDQQGQDLSMPFLPSPLDSSGMISSEFVASTRLYRFISEESEPVLAVSNGKISQIQSTKNKGYTFLLTHSDVTGFQYRFMSEVASHLTNGAEVNQGDTVGVVSVFRSGESGVEIACWQLGEKTDGLPDSYPSPVTGNEDDQTSLMKMIRKLSKSLDKIHPGLI